MAGKQIKPIRIFMTADTMGGVWTYAIELIKAWEPSGIQVALATMGQNLNLQQRVQITQLSNLTLYESNFKLEWMDKPWGDVAAAGEWLLQRAQEFKPDIIHLNNFCHGHLNWGKPVVMVVHSCVASWWQAVKGEAAPPEWDFYKKQVAAGLQAADVVVAPSQAMLEEARVLYGPFKLSHLVYNGHDTSVFKFAAKEPFIFSMGRVWDEAKNIQKLAQVGAHLDWPVYIAGEARHPVRDESMMLPNVHFLGKLSETEIINLLSRAAIFCLPVKYEPFGLAILEAALSGCALVVGDIPSQREIWGPAATYVNPDDAKALEAALEELIQEEMNRHIMGSRARQRGRKYTIKQTAREYHKVFCQLLGQTSTQKSRSEILI